MAKNNYKDIFSEFKQRLLNIDPVAFCESNLTLDGKPFRLNGNGYKPFAEIYRQIGIKSIERSSKPIILVKGRQVGATTMAAALECYFMASGLFGTNGRPPMRIMHLFPSLVMAAGYTKQRLSTMVSSSRQLPGTFKPNGLPKSFIEAYLDTSSPSNDSVYYKKFLHENQLWIDSTGLAGDRIRGRTADGIFYDEVQDIRHTAIGTANKTLSKAQYGPVGEGLQIYLGTPKQKGSSYWNMWESSSQQYYHLGCGSCGEYFPLYRPDVDWEEVWLYGFVVKCTECGYEQDKIKAAERGKWVALGHEEDSRLIGYHINQLYMPDFPKELILDQKPENNQNNTERVYKNEVLGEFYDGEGSMISLEEIHEYCGEVGRSFSKEIHSDNKKVYVGFDWGQKGTLEQLAGRQRGQSYSCAVVLTAEGPQLFNVEFATQISRTDMQSKIDVVEEIFRRYSIDLAVGDIGDAFDLTHVLQRKYQDRFLASRAQNQISGHVKFNNEIFPKEIIFERDYYISDLVGLLKNGHIKFPYGDYEKLQWLINHCCSMEVKVTQRNGEPYRHFVKGPTPNDGFMALLNAYLAFKFDVTEGFKIKQPGQIRTDKATKKKPQIPAVLGHISKF